MVIGAARDCGAIGAGSGAKRGCAVVLPFFHSRQQVDSRVAHGFEAVGPRKGRQSGSIRPLIALVADEPDP